MAHVLELEFARDVEHVERQVLLERAEEQRAKLQLHLQVLVALRLVILVRS